MPWISRRVQSETAALVARLRARAEQAEAATRVQAGANGILAARSGDTEAELREQVRQLRVTRDGLLVQLSRALGYNDEQLAAIDAGATVKGGTAA
ncbi:hypothetical protein [Kitasatospora sp. CB01950]|uniref:hypothetical protein n=1 Tax=Kitasatospora sp. CB01950 TaxID=1703930 RepID=UPI00093F3F6C|nr:hypothetical protein [Kitasatospora sp. CB01950]OKJ06800.1 hypothetical protein AMK19_23370 [Kitasatospora sp. CB01950]